MELKSWEFDKPRLLTALGKMEAWTATLLEGIQEAKQVVEKSQDDFIFKPESHPVGVPEFEMTMRDIDSPLREIIAIHQAIQEHYRENVQPLETGKLMEKPDFTSAEIAQVLQLMQQSTASGEEGAAPMVVHITPDKIELRIETDK